MSSLLLFYHNVSGRSIGKITIALTSGHIVLPYREAVELAAEVVFRYSTTFDNLISQLTHFRE